jgi:hypothetical protein
VATKQRAQSFGGRIVGDVGGKSGDVVEVAGAVKLDVGIVVVGACMVVVAVDVGSIVGMVIELGD